MDQDKSMRSRKFILASVSLATGIAGLFTAKMAGTEFVYLVAVILTAYGAANILPSIVGPKK